MEENLFFFNDYQVGSTGWDHNLRWIGSLPSLNGWEEVVIFQPTPQSPSKRKVNRTLSSFLRQ